jgi:O-antigen/teichoic acid export membrane protein
LSVPASNAPSYIGRNILWLFVSQVLTWAVTLVMLVVVPNKLGSDDFGLLVFTTAFVGFFAFVGSLGTGTFITRAVARDPDLLGPYVFNALVMKALASVVLALAAFGLALALGYSSTALALIALYLATMFFTLLGEVAVGGLQGISRMARPAAWNVVQVYAGAAVGLAILLTHGGVVAFASSSLIAAIPCIANVKNVWTFVRGHAHVDFAVWRVIVRGGVPLLILSGLMLIYGNIDIPLLEGLTDNRTVGQYALAYRWVSVPVFVSTIVVSAFAPSLSAFAHEASDRFASLANRSLRLVIAVGIPAATGTIVIAYDLIDLLYHRRYPDSALLIRILAVHIPLATISTVLGAILVAKDRQSRYSIVALIAAVTNPPLTIFAIKLTLRWAHNGAIGAAVATVLTECLMVGGAYILRPTGVFDRGTMLFALRCLAANACMAAPLLVFHDLELFIKVGIGIVLYVAASLLFRTFTLADVRTVMTQARSVVGRNRRRPVRETEVVEHALPEEHEPDRSIGSDVHQEPEPERRPGGEGSARK